MAGGKGELNPDEAMKWPRDKNFLEEREIMRT